METEFKKRWTAFKVPIGIIAKGELKLEKNPNDPSKEKFSFLNFENKKINRINIIANVIDKYESTEKNYAALTIDDGTGNLRIKAFSDTTAMIKNIGLGTSILIIGTLRYYNNEIYILPEIIKEIDPRWLLARKLELEKEFGNIYKELSLNIPQTAQQIIQPAPLSNSSTHAETQKNEEVKEEKIITEKIQDNKPSIREEILNIIKEAEAEQGINIDKILLQLNNQPAELIKESITKLLEAGEIFEPQPGKLRIL